MPRPDAVEFSEGERVIIHGLASARGRAHNLQPARVEHGGQALEAATVVARVPAPLCGLATHQPWQLLGLDRLLSRK